MWSHYIVAAMRLMSGLPKSATQKFRQITGWIALAAIILHPSLLVYRLWQDGFGLPPGSYLDNYVAPSLKWAALLGTFSLLIFLAYELYRWFENRRWWAYMQGLSDIAMLFILLHGFRLGGNLQSGWFRIVWLIYAVGLILALVYIYYRKLKRGKDMIG